MTLLLFFLMLSTLYQKGWSQELLLNTEFKFPVIPENQQFIIVPAGLNFHWFYLVRTTIVGIPYGTIQTADLNMTQALMLTYYQRVFQRFRINGEWTPTTRYNLTLTVHYYPPQTQTMNFITVYILPFCLLTLSAEPSTTLRILQTRCLVATRHQTLFIEGHGFWELLIDSFKITLVSLVLNSQFEINPLQPPRIKKLKKILKMPSRD